MNPASKQKRIAFGYMRLANNQIAIHEGQGAALQLIYAMYAEGKSLAEIKSVLEGMNVPSPYNGRSWGKQTLSNLLSTMESRFSPVTPAFFSAISK